MRTAPVVSALFFAVTSFASVTHADSLSITLETTTVGGNYAPRNVVAVWVEDDAGQFVPWWPCFPSPRTASSAPRPA